MTTIGQRLREERERLGYSQPAFGALGGKSKQTVIQWEAGEQFPNGAFLAAAAAHGADVQYILTGRHGAPAMSADEERAGYVVKVLSPEEVRALDGLRLGGLLPANQSAVITGDNNSLNQSQGGTHGKSGRKPKRPD